MTSGAAASDLLDTGCRLDPPHAAFRIACTRTVLTKVDETLWRRRPVHFRLKVDRSFARYVSEYLRKADGGRDA